MFKTKSTKAMLHLALAIMAAVLIIACGSSDNDSGGSLPGQYDVGPLYEGQPMGIECAGLTSDSGATCDQDMSFKPKGLRASSFDIGNVPLVTSDAGAFGLNDFIFTQLIVQNYTPQHHRYWLHIQYNVCGGYDAASTYPTSILPMQTIDQGNIGSEFSYCSGGLLEPSIVISIFNGAGLADDELGDPFTSEAFAQAIVNFSFSNSP